MRAKIAWFVNPTSKPKHFFLLQGNRTAMNEDPK